MHGTRITRESPVSHPALTPQSLTLTAAALAPKVGLLLALSLSVIGGALYVPNAVVGLVLLAIGATLLATAAIVRFLADRRKRAQKSLHDTIASFVQLDAAPSFTTNHEGVIGYRNTAAKERFGSVRDDQTLVHALGDLFASPADTLFRLQNKALGTGSAREDVVMRRGHMRLSVHQIGDDGFLWRLEDLVERSSPGRSAEGISLPMMTVSKTGTVLFMNDAARRLLGGRKTSLDRVFSDLPLRPGQIHSVAGADGPVNSRVTVVESTVGRQEIYFVPAQQHTSAPNAGWDFFDELPVPMLKIAADGEIRTCNRAASNLLAIDTAVGQQLGDLVEGLGRSITDWLADSAVAAGDIKSEFVRASRQPKEVYLQISLSRVVDKGETLLVAMLNDATQLKTLEAQFVQSQKMQAIGQLAGGVAHDFNNLLTAISGHCDLLLLRHDQGDQDYGDLTQINQNANRAASLVGQLLAFSRKQTLKPEIVDIAETLNDLAHLLNRLVGEKVTLALNHDSDLLAIKADKRQLEQVIMNLVVNARDAMPNGGEVKIDAHVEQFKEAYERDRASVPAGEYVVVTVTDEGVGIPHDKLPKIFEPFYTTKRTGEGTGLGLSMAYGIVKQTGGFIFADSVPGSGTSFTLFFPTHSPIVQEPEPVPVEIPRPTHVQDGGVVLLVEDEAPVRAFASRALRMRGYTVLEAKNAEEALLTLEDGDLNIDIFVTDVIMPGMDGPSWVAKALETRPGVKVVFVSGYAEESFSQQQARIPNSVFLPKPFSLNELTATVQQQLH